MPTVQNKIVDTTGAGDYTSWTAWEAAQPASLVASDVVWRGLGKKQTFTETVTVAGSTTDATRYAEMTTDTGASFADDANVQTNALKANASNGALITSASTYTQVLSINQDFCRVNKLQITGTSATTTALAMLGSFTFDLAQCILEHVRPVAVAQLSGSTAKIRNTLLVQKGASAVSILKLSSGASAYNVTAVVPTNVAHPTNIVEGLYGTPVVQNCALFGNGAAFKTGGNSPTYTTNKSDAASLPSGVTTAAYDATTFVAVDASYDYRLVSGSALIDAGSINANDTPDIVGTSRSGSYDIGAWEFLSSGADVLLGQACL